LLEKILIMTLILNIVSTPLMVKMSDKVSFRKLYLCLLATAYVLPVIAFSLVLNNMFLTYLSAILYLAQILFITLSNMSHAMVSALFMTSYGLMFTIISLGFI